MREQVIKAVEAEKIIAIVRGVEASKCMKVAEALYAGGIRMMEITYNQRDRASWKTTAESISAIREKFDGKMYVGAGTVTSPELVELTSSAGGQYIISPDSNPAVIGRTRELELVSMPGAMTPTEILIAHNAGADFVKLFPAGELGPGYMKAVRAPISNVKMLAVGGINEKNIPDFLAVGAVGFGIGGNLANLKWVESGEFEKLTAAAEAMLAAVKG